jgi:hypothetical protein
MYTLSDMKVIQSGHRPAGPASSNSPLPTPRQSLDDVNPSIAQNSQIPTIHELQIPTELSIQPSSSPNPDNPRPLTITPPDSPDDLHPLPPQINLEELLGFLARESHDSMYEIKGIDNNDLKMLDHRARAGKLPGWDSGVRYVRSLVLIRRHVYTLTSRSLVDDTLFLKYPSMIHEIIPDVFDRLKDQGTRLPSGRKPGSILRNFGNADIPLLIGSITPDYSIYEENKDDKATLHLQIHPTIVIEVGYSQKIQELRLAAARLIGSSLGAVQLVVAIKLSYGKIAGQEREAVETASAEFWELEESNKISQWPGCLNRVIDISNRKGQPDNPLATKYQYVMRENATTFAEVRIECTEVHDVRCTLSSVHYL